MRALINRGERFLQNDLVEMRMMGRRPARPASFLFLLIVFFLSLLAVESISTNYAEVQDQPVSRKTEVGNLAIGAGRGGSFGGVRGSGTPGGGSKGSGGGGGRGSGSRSIPRTIPVVVVGTAYHRRGGAGSANCNLLGLFICNALLLLAIM